MYPPIEPNRHGWAEVGDGHLVYWEESGNPEGKPVVILHGGPGSGCSANTRRSYHPERYRIVIFDQRNCGRSQPYAGDDHVDLSTNTTHHLIGDIEFLREFLGIDKWMLQGGSWGAALALAYAERHPDRVSELLLLSATAGRHSEVDLLTHGLGRMFKAAWTELTAFAAQDSREGGILDKMHRLLFDGDPAVRDEAARQWCAWETAMLPTNEGPGPKFADPRFRLCFARLVTHYWRHNCWLEPDELLNRTDSIRHIPGKIIQGRLDLGNLSGTPWELAARLPNLELQFIEESGHSGSPRFSDALLAYTDGLVALDVLTA